jgi:hypothetical protein
MIVEPDFTDRSCVRRGPNRGVHDCSGIGLASGELAGLVRMHADAIPNARPRLREMPGTRRLCVVFRGKDTECVRQARRLCPGDHRIDVVHERVIRQMTMRIDHEPDGTRDW